MAAQAGSDVRTCRATLPTPDGGALPLFMVASRGAGEGWLALLATDGVHAWRNNGWPPPAGTQNPSLWLDKVLEQLSGNLTDKDGSVEAACEDGGELQLTITRPNPATGGEFVDAARLMPDADPAEGVRAVLGVLDATAAAANQAMADGAAVQRSLAQLQASAAEAQARGLAFGARESRVFECLARLLNTKKKALRAEREARQAAEARAERAEREIEALLEGRPLPTTPVPPALAPSGPPPAGAGAPPDAGRGAPSESGACSEDDGEGDAGSDGSDYGNGDVSMREDTQPLGVSDLDDGDDDAGGGWG